jgi:hypothetical protein
VERRQLLAQGSSLQGVLWLQQLQSLLSQRVLLLLLLLLPLGLQPLLAAKCRL